MRSLPSQGNSVFSPPLAGRQATSLGRAHVAGSLGCGASSPRRAADGRPFAGDSVLGVIWRKAAPAEWECEWERPPRLNGNVNGNGHPGWEKGGVGKPRPVLKAPPVPPKRRAGGDASGMARLNGNAGMRERKPGGDGEKRTENSGCPHAQVFVSCWRTSWA